MLYDVWVNNIKIEDNFFFRKLYISFITSFLYSLISTIAFKKFREDRIKYGIVVSFLVFALCISFCSENSGSINPLLYIPFMLASFTFYKEYFILQILVPLFAGYLGTYLALYSFKDFCNSKSDDKNINTNLELIPPKKILFEM
jgi:hypothetical protein